MAEKKVSVKVQDLTKTFKIPLEASSGIKQKIINLAKGRKGYREFTPLNDVSFEVNDGDFFGIVGRNGSGKSTLLKTIAGIYQPDAGAVTVNGKLVPFIELGVGFNPELSGKENVFLNGALLGFSRSEMQAMYDDIVDFAELHDFMEEKLKNYSSGMQVRLAFSIAIKVQGDILLLDEVLAVGDEAFQRKCYDYFAQIRKEKRTVILVTHDMDSVQKFCNKAIMIEKGRIIEYGNPAIVARKYRELFMDENDKGIRIKDGSVRNANINAKADFISKDGKLIFDITIIPRINIDDTAVVFLINKSNGERVYRWATDINDIDKVNLSRDFRLHIELDDIFPVDNFYAGVSIVNKDRTKEFAVFDNLIEFKKYIEPGESQWDINWKPKEKYTISNI